MESRPHDAQHTNGTINDGREIARELWSAMPAAERLPVIMDRFPVEDWFLADALPTLAIFRQGPPGQWGFVRARYKAIGGDPFALEREVDKLIAMAEAVDALDPAARRPAITSMDTVQSQPVQWLWWPYIALGKLCMMDGDPGTGKSLLALQLAACLSRGFPLPDQQGRPTLSSGEPTCTLLLSTEDGLADTVAPRLERARADKSKIKVLTGWLDTENDHHAFTLEYMDVLKRTLDAYGPRLVIIDPIQSYIGGIDMHRANETRPLLAQLAVLAEQHACAMVCIRHPSKPGQHAGKAIHRGLGSVDFIGAARTGLYVEEHPVDKTRVLLCHIKSNIGPMGRTQIYAKAQGEFTWCGVTRVPLDVVMGAGYGPDPHALVQAAFWLEHRLQGRPPVPYNILEEELDEEEFKKMTIRRAKKLLGILSLRRGEAWEWQLPDLPVVSPGAT